MWLIFEIKLNTFVGLYNLKNDCCSHLLWPLNAFVCLLVSQLLTITVKFILADRVISQQYQKKETACFTHSISLEYIINVMSPLTNLPCSQFMNKAVFHCINLTLNEIQVVSGYNNITWTFLDQNLLSNLHVKLSHVATVTGVHCKVLPKLCC